MRLSLVQVTVGPHIDKNFQKVDKFINQALSFDPDLILLPECFLFLSNLKKTSFTMDHDYILHYQNFTKINKVNLLLGSLPILDEGKVYNRSILINQDGSISSYYDKIHMFDVSVNDNTGSYRESATTEAGDTVVTVETPIGNIGLAVCYDVRFPGLFTAMGDIAILVLPAAFTQRTGEAHWHALLQARAIEKQCFVVAANQSGVHANGRETYGHSLVLSPWGETLAESKTDVGLVSAKVDIAERETIKQNMPVAEHNRFRSHLV